MDFPTRLRTLRESRSLSQEDLANELDIPRSTITNLEKSDGSRLPRKDRLEKIADFFGVSLDYLLGRTNDPIMTYARDASDLVRGLPAKIPVNLEESEDDYVQAFSKRLNEEIRKKDISLEHAAEACGVTPEYIQKLMYNPDKLPGIGTLYKLANLFGVTPDYLGGYIGDPQGRSPQTPRPSELADFLKKQDIMFYGVPLDEDDKQKIENVLIGLFWESKEMNKRKK